MLVSVLRLAFSLFLFGASLSATCAQNAVETRTKPIGDDKITDTKILEAGAKLLQGNAPLHGFDIYDGEVIPGLVEQRDKAMNLDTAQTRKG